MIRYVTIRYDTIRYDTIRADTEQIRTSARQCHPFNKKPAEQTRRHLVYVLCSTNQSDCARSCMLTNQNARLRWPVVAVLFAICISRTSEKCSNPYLVAIACFSRTHKYHW